MTTPPKGSGLKDAASGRQDLFRVNPSKLQIKEGWNARNFDDPTNAAHIQDLKASIKEHGVLEPLTVSVEDGLLYLTNGECRLRAVRELQEEGVEIKAVPVRSELRHSSDADHILSQITRNMGKTFEPLEQAEVFKRLLAYGMTEEEIGVKVGKTKERVGQILLLNTATAKSKKLVSSGKVSPTLLQQTLQKSKSPKDAEAKLASAVKAAKDQGRSKAKPRDVSEPKKATTLPSAPKATKRAETAQTIAAELVEASRLPPNTYGESEQKIQIVTTEARWQELQKIAKGE